MNAPATTILNEVRALISAQLDTLQSAAPFTSDQLEEMHNRAERIRMLCKGMSSEERREQNPTELRELSIVRKRIRSQSIAA